MGIDRNGCHYAIPVQAKGGKDQISVVQARQDITWVEKKYRGMRCRAISAQFMGNDRVAMFELTIQKDLVVVLDEKHYKLVPAASLDQQAIINYR